MASPQDRCSSASTKHCFLWFWYTNGCGWSYTLPGSQGTILPYWCSYVSSPSRIPGSLNSDLGKLVEWCILMLHLDSHSRFGFLSAVPRLEPQKTPLGRVHASNSFSSCTGGGFGEVYSQHLVGDFMDSNRIDQDWYAWRTCYLPSATPSPTGTTSSRLHDYT